MYCMRSWLFGSPQIRNAGTLAGNVANAFALPFFLLLVAEGLTNRQIAEQMFLAEKTVKNYVSNLFAKLGMSQRTEAAVWAARLDERGEPTHYVAVGADISQLKHSQQQLR